MLLGEMIRARAWKTAGAGLTTFALDMSVLAMTTMVAFSEGRYATWVL
jgi:hypothetical protein